MAHHIIQIMSRIFCTILFITINITAESDWLQECGKCKCKWSSNKKFGDCRNISINRVPLGLSTELQVVDLSFNTFTEIRKQEFTNANLQNLHKLFLRNCSLREINRDGLKNLKILIEIDLSYNLMKFIHPGVFFGLIKLRTVILNNNQLERLDDRLFENLDFLHKLELKENRLHKISLNTFVNVPVLSQIYLDSNNLRTLRRESFHNLEKLTSLSLAENPWNCTCDLKAFRDFTIENNLYTPPTDCHEPPSLRGKLWSEIPTDYFACKPKILIPLAGALLDAYTENVTLTCRIKGSPTPDVTWYYNKQIINDYERRYHVKKLVEKVTRNTMETVTSELTIIGVKSTDKGTYTCIAKNRGGKDQADILLAISLDDDRHAKGFQSINLLVVVCLVCASILLVLIIGLLYHVFKRRKSSPNSLDKNIIEDKIERHTHDDMDNVIINSRSTLAKDTQKGSQEVNLIEKPIRRAYVELNGNAVIERPNECSKIRIDESNFAVNLFNDNGTTNSSTILTDPLTTTNQIQTTTTTLTTTGPTKSYQKFFINDNSHLPPDLLTLPT